MGNSNTRKFKEELENKLQVVDLYPALDGEVFKITSRRPTKAAPQSVQRKILHAQPIEEVEEAKVNVFDGRKQVLATAKWPNSVHGLVAFKFKDTTNWGTGILIGPNVVLTAGHNLYSHKFKAYADLPGLQFFPGMNGHALPFGEAQIDQYFVSPNYIKDKEKEDYGILILKEPVGNLTGYFGLACLEPEEIKKKKINVTGYPYDKVVQNSYEMWGMEGEAALIDQDRGVIKYQIDTEAGQSGSGVWFQEGEDYYVCGVHVTGTQFVNTATLLTQTMYKQIRAWIQQVGFKKPFLRLRDTNELRFQNQEIKIDAQCLSLLVKYNLDNLKTLHLSSEMMGNEEAKILAQNTSWINLSKLSLSNNNIDAEGAQALAKNTSWISLSQLDLSINYLGAEGAKALAQNTSWINLSQLGLSINHLGGKGVKELSQNTSWINLSKLSLRRNDIGAKGTKALAQNVSWINLSKLDLSSNNINPEGVKELTQNTPWVNLASLDLSCNNINTEGVKILAQNISWVNLSKLRLRSANISVEGAKELAQNTSWVNLSKLDLFKNNICAEGAKELAQNTSWINLSKLNLRANNIGAEGAKGLAQNTSWSNLTILNLEENHIDETEARVLRQNKSWKKNIKIKRVRAFHNPFEDILQDSSDSDG